MEVIRSDNTGNFFKYVNKKLSNKKGIGELIDDANQVVNNDAAKVNMFNAFFASNCVVDNGIIPETPNVAPNTASLDSIDFNPSSVLRDLKKSNQMNPAAPMVSRLYFFISLLTALPTLFLLFTSPSCLWVMYPAYGDPRM